MSKYETTLDLIQAYHDAHARVHGPGRVIVDSNGNGTFRMTVTTRGLPTTLGNYRREVLEKAVDNLNARADKAERKAL